MSSQHDWSENQVVELLRQVSLFEGLPDEDLRGVAGIVRGDSVDEGEFVFQEGDEGDSYYIVYSGAVEIIKSHADGHEEKLAVRRSGDGFGEMALLNDAPRSASARALEPTRLFRVDREDFQDLLGGDSLAARMMQTLSRALRALDIRFAAQSRAATRETGELTAFNQALLHGILPRAVPRIPGYSVAAGTGLHEGGETGTAWDAFPLGERPALSVTSVVGKGLPPAHLLAVGRALLRHAAGSRETPGEVLGEINRGMGQAPVLGVDQHLECGLLRFEEGGITWASAGTVGAVQVTRDGSVRELASHGPPLGVLPGFQYAGRSLELQPGDHVLMLSGASAGLLRGAGDLVYQRRDRSVEEVLTALQAAIRKARGGEPVSASAILIRAS